MGKFKKYYRNWFFVIALLYIFVLVVRYIKFGESDIDIFFPLFLLAMATFLGGIFHFYYEYYQQRRLAKLLLRIKGLEALDFELDEGVYSGNYRKFYMVALPTTSIDGGETVEFNIMIMPKEHQLDILKEIGKKFDIIANEQFFSLKVSIPLILGKLPKLEKIQKKLDPAVDILIRNKIEPLLDYFEKLES